MPSVEVGEQLLVAGLVGVVELFDDPRPYLVDQRGRLEARQRQAHGAEDQAGAVEVRPDGVVDPRILDLDRHGAPVPGDGPVDLPDGGRGDGHRIPFQEQSAGGGAQLPLNDAGGELGRHGRCILLQALERLAHVVRQPGVEVRRHLAQLHEGAFHVAEHLGHLVGRPQLEPPVELDPAFGAGKGPPGTVEREVGAGPSAHPGQRDPPLVSGARRDRGAGVVDVQGLAGPSSGGDGGDGPAHEAQRDRALAPSPG